MNALSSSRDVSGRISPSSLHPIRHTSSVSASCSYFPSRPARISQTRAPALTSFAALSPRPLDAKAERLKRAHGRNPPAELGRSERCFPWVLLRVSNAQHRLRVIRDPFMKELIARRLTEAVLVEESAAPFL